jgi:hypothetical protein
MKWLLLGFMDGYLASSSPLPLLSIGSVDRQIPLCGQQQQVVTLDQTVGILLHDSPPSLVFAFWTTESVHVGGLENEFHTPHSCL